MAETVEAPRFEEHFWGPGNKGFDVLLQNYKVGLGSSKELNDFIKERMSVEDGYVKNLSKLSKNVAAVPTSALGSLTPLWQALQAMCENLTAAHAQFVLLLQDLLREISEYNISQREKMKGNLKGEIDDAQDSLRLLETQEAALHRAKKLYTQSVEQFVKQQKKMEKAKGDPNPKTKQQLESRLKQAENWMVTMKEDYKLAVETHTRQFRGFDGNMTEACKKFGAIEEEHLAQMITFVMKMSEAQETTHILIGKSHQKLHAQMESNSVEKLLCAFVEARGTGREKPAPEKFRPVSDRALATLAAVTHEDNQLKLPSADSQKPIKPDKSIRQRIRFKKKGKEKSATADQNSDHVISEPQENIPVGEVDEEGYSIRPEDAAAIRGFPDDDPNQDSDDSDFEDDFQSRVRQVHIKDPSQDVPKATVDDIRASVQTLKLGTQPGTRIRKATSSQSLNNILHTPPMDRKTDVAGNASTHDPVMSSLLDSDISISPGVGGMATPLQPLPLSVFSTDPTEPLRPLATPPLLLSPFSPSSTTTTATITATVLTPSPPTATAPPSSSSSSSTLPPGTTERPVPKPRQGKSDTGRRVALTSSPESSPKKHSPSDLGQEGEKRVKVLSSGWNSSSDDESPVLPPTIPTFSIYDSPKSDVSVSSYSFDGPTDGGEGGGGAGAIMTPPLPLNPRRNTRQRGNTPETQSLSPLVKTQMTNSPATTPTSPLTSLPLSLPTLTTPPITTTTNSSTSQAPPQATPTGVPLAVAFQETCNAIFKSTDPKDCLLKVTGEMVVSFPASLVGQVEGYGRLSFRLRDAENLKQVLHNQILLSREGDTYGYYFNTPALSAHLNSMASKKTAPFYNMQIIKYEVDIADGSLLPVRLAAYWKCTELITNFRFDYSYIADNLPPSVGPSRPPVTQMTVCVPVDGGVRNTLSRPSGTWMADKQQILWKIGEVAPSDSDNVTSIHAKFDVTSGPSLPQPAEVRFVCDGSTVSGVDLDLLGTDYRVSLLKKKFCSGKYVAEMRY